MAVSIWYDKKDNGCDICRKQKSELTINIEQSTRYERNQIIVHESCLNKQIEKAKLKRLATA